jgi:hypothetical protein
MELLGRDGDFASHLTGIASGNFHRKEKVKGVSLYKLEATACPTDF